jgi:L-amino acid N-acyltransferase YncA
MQLITCTYADHSRAILEIFNQEIVNHAGTIEQAGFKFGRWLDLGFYQLLLAAPDCPVDGSG